MPVLGVGQEISEPTRTEHHAVRWRLRCRLLALLGPPAMSAVTSAPWGGSILDFVSLRLSVSGPHRTFDHQQRRDEIVVVDVLTACFPAAVRQTISRAQSMNRFTAGLRVRSLSVTTAAGHGRTG